MSVLNQKLNAGPKGVGDPKETSLRKVETEILIPKLMRDRAVKEKCIVEGDAFSRCCADAGVFMTWKCKSVSKELYGCLEKWYKDEEFKKECTEQYLRERTAFRSSGVAKKMRAKESEIM